MSSHFSKTQLDILAAAWRLFEHHGSRRVRMADVAAEAGVSRQAVYLNFGSRVGLVVELVRHIDQTQSAYERSAPVREAVTGVEALARIVQFWASYVTEITAVARALESARAEDEAAEAAWQDRMLDHRGLCRIVVTKLFEDGTLSEYWGVEEATDLLWALLSVRMWEDLTGQRGWTKAHYRDRLIEVTRRILLRHPDLG